MSQDTAQRIRALAERGGIQDALALAESVLPGLSGIERAHVLLAHGAVQGMAGELQAALRSNVDACQIFEAANDRTGLCDALVQTAGTLRGAGDHGTAISTLEQAESLAREVGDPLRAARVQRTIGVVSSIIGRHQHALACLEEAVSQLEQHAPGDEARTARLSRLNAASRRLRSLGDEAERRTQAQAVLVEWALLAEDATAAGHARLALMAWGNHAIILQPAGRIPDAVQALRALLPRYREMDMRPNEALAHAELGRCHEALAEPGQAREHYRQALALLPQAETSDDRLEALEGLARCEEALGDIASALQALKDVRQSEKRRSDDAARQSITQRELRIELARLTDQWARQATQDPLTGLANRRALERWLAERWPRVERGRTLSLLLLDLDHFKQVNDHHGHGVGDEVLKAVARLLQAHGRAADLAVRYGGEEFLLALDDADSTGASALAQRVRAAVADHPWHDTSPSLMVTTSIGVAEAREVMDIEALLTLADKRLYAAKLGGRNRVVADA